MRFCHAAALALVGWYLMVPPRYRVREEMGKLSRCRDGQSHAHSSQRRRAMQSGVASQDSISASAAIAAFPPEEVYDAQCIASDDPRLKGD
jgi:hypothetical protein